MDREATRVSCTEQTDKTALAQANVPGKVWFDNKYQRYLYPEQRLHTPVGQPGRRSAEVGSRARTPAAQSTVLQPTADEGRQGRGDLHQHLSVQPLHLPIKFCWHQAIVHVLSLPPHPPAQPPCSCSPALLWSLGILIRASG